MINRSKSYIRGENVSKTGWTVDENAKYNKDFFIVSGNEPKMEIIHKGIGLKKLK